MRLLISKEKTAAEILESTPVLNDIVSFQLERALSSATSLSKYKDTKMYEFLKDLGADHVSPTTAGVRVIKKNNIDIADIYGTAVFKKDKLVGWLDSDEARNVLWVKGEILGGIVVATQNIVKPYTDVSLEVFRSKTKLEPQYENQRLKMKVKIEAEVGIAELGTEKDLIQPEGRNQLKQAAEKKLEKEIEDIVKKIQEKYQIDVFGFSHVVEIKKPQVWEKVKDRWEEVFQQMDVVLDVDLEIKGSAVLSKPIKVGE